MKVCSVLFVMVFCFTINVFPQVAFTPHTITTEVSRVNSVYAIDVDGDGDMDVLSGHSGVADNIAWYENDGSENFSPHTIATVPLGSGTMVYATDLDSDGDVDVLSSSGLDSAIVWYENDGNENFTPHPIVSIPTIAASVYAVDVDGDGDIDVLSTAAIGFEIVWYENDGNENFTSHTITTNALAAVSVYAIDVDGDGDIDVLSAMGGFDQIVWYENDGNENFTAHAITTDEDAAVSVYAIDIDGDEDIDVLSASDLGNKIAWYENDGNENFTSHTISTTAFNAHSVFAVDIDSDGDMDVLSGHEGVAGQITWYENLGPVGIEAISNDIPSEFILSQNYPNPFNPSTNIKYSIPSESFVELKVFDVLGNEVATLVNQEQSAGIYRADFNAENLPSGMYFARITANEFTQVVKMILLK